MASWIELGCTTNIEVIDRFIALQGMFVIDQYDSFEQFADHFGSRSFNLTYTSADIRKPAVEAAFDRLGGTDHRFISPRQMTFMKGLKTIGF